MVQGKDTGAPAPAPHPQNSLARIEAYVCLTAVILTFLIIFGSFRRRCHNKLLKTLVWVSYDLSTYLVTYTMGLMQSASFPSQLFAIWGSFLLFVIGSANSISAYSLQDNEHHKRHNWEYLFQICWLGWLIGVYDDDTQYEVLLWLLFVVIFLKTGERARAYMLASRSTLQRNTKLIADFMRYEHELSKQDEVDPTNMKGYNYVVRGEAEKKVKADPPYYLKQLMIDDEVITIHKIWQCDGNLLTSTRDRDAKLKDICLSFALYKLICRRFTGYPFLEPFQKSWNFVWYGLLSEGRDYERAFRVIEVELVFLFGLFYTKYPAIFEPGRLKWKIIDLIFVVIGCLVAAFTLSNYKHKPNKEFINLPGYQFRIDLLVTGIVIAAIVLLEVVQMGFIIFSDWAKVILLCKYVQKPSWKESKCIEKMIEFVCLRQWLKPWERKIGQYSLLRSFNYNPSILLYNCLTSDFLDKPGKGRKESTRIELSADVKKTIILSLRNCNGQRLSNGEASLHRNHELGNNLIWACQLETTTHVIMVWHIATSLCELNPSKSASPIRSEHFTVATSLSKYCAYLVAFAPRFLPGNAYDSEFIFDKIVIETREFLEECKSLEQRVKKMMTLGDGNPGDIVIRRGAVLGNRLLGIRNEEQRWKILAEFWAEMMLFVAPSDDATIHAEYLAQGGEFVTHLWALLSHAGILKQDSVVPEI